MKTVKLHNYWKKKGSQARVEKRKEVEIRTYSSGDISEL